MSTAKKKAKKPKNKANLPTPPPRTRSLSPSPYDKTKAQLTPISTNPRSRSRSANNRQRAPDHPSPPAPHRTKSGSRTPDKPNKLPTPTRWKSRNSAINKKLPSTPTKPSPPISKKTSEKLRSSFHTKQLPNTPTRIRARTTTPQSKLNKQKKLPTIDNRPSLKPSRSNKKKPLPKYTETKQDEKKQNQPQPPPPPRGNGHQRDYSILKSLPLMFKSKPTESPRTKKNKLLFGLKPPPRKAPKLNKREALIGASCQCGNVKYELMSLPQELQHCYCSMCRKLHGSSVATWTPFLEQDIRFIKKGKQTKYKSSDNVTRSFCSKCGSNVSLKYKFQTDTLWLTPSLFDGPTEKHMNNMNAKSWWLDVRVLHIFCASKCEWYDIPNDGYPQLSQTDIQNSEINGEPRFMYLKDLPPKPMEN